MDQLQWAATGFMEHWGWFVALFATMSAGFLYLYRRQQRHLVLLMASSPAALLLFQAQKGELMFATWLRIHCSAFAGLGKISFFLLIFLLNSCSYCSTRLPIAQKSGLPL